MAFSQQPANTFNVVADGGAVGDGVADDTAALNAAISAAKSAGENLYFPKGTYLVSGWITFKKDVSLLGDKTGVSLIKAAGGIVEIGRDNDGSTLENLSVEDLFFLNVSVVLKESSHDNNTIRRCVFASDTVHTEDWFQCVLSRGNCNTVEDCIFMAGHNSGSWNGFNLKGFNTFNGNNITVRRNIFGLDLGNLDWLASEWAGYGAWNQVEGRLTQLRLDQGLPSRMGEMGGGLRLNGCGNTLVDQNIFNFDIDACDVPQDANNLNVDHFIYATEATDLVITRNWMRGFPSIAGGGLKHRDTVGPGVIAANYFDDTPLLLYSYISDPARGFENQLIYRNHFRITDVISESNPGKERTGIEFQTTDTHTGTNIKIDANIFDVALGQEANAPINLHEGYDTDWLVYPSNRYLPSSNVVAIIGKNGPYAHAGGTAPSVETAPYENLEIPFLSIPLYGEAPSPVFASTNEAETVLLGGVSTAASNGGYTGAGYTVFQNAGGDSIEWPVGVLGDGLYTLAFRYALPAADRPLRILVNGIELTPALSFPPTAGWSSWSYTPELAVHLNAGINMVRAISIGYGGANIDHLVVRSSHGDRDDDGLPDLWEQQYFGAATVASATADADGDGAHNLAEYIAGCSPVDSDSVFAISGMQVSQGSQYIIIDWEPQPGRVYVILKADGLKDSFTSAASNLVYPAFSYTGHIESAHSDAFYQLKVGLDE